MYQLIEQALNRQISCPKRLHTDIKSDKSTKKFKENLIRNQKFQKKSDIVWKTWRNYKYKFKQSTGNGSNLIRCASNLSSILSSLFYYYFLIINFSSYVIIKRNVKLPLTISTKLNNATNDINHLQVYIYHTTMSSVKFHQ